MTLLVNSFDLFVSTLGKSTSKVDRCAYHICKKLIEASNKHCEAFSEAASSLKLEFKFKSDLFLYTTGTVGATSAAYFKKKAVHVWDRVALWDSVWPERIKAAALKDNALDWMIPSEIDRDDTDDASDENDDKEDL